jgi:lipopolysaccharide export system ATP-binding protein
MLKVDSVYLEFAGRKILQDIYIDCKPGEITGLLGRNGSGKSSLLKCIFGTLTPSHKYISVNNKHISKGYKDGEIAYLPQHNYLPQHLTIGQCSRMLVAENDWVEFNTHDIFKQFSYSKPWQLSGGELRRLETLIILYSKANYILLDEPFTHLSPIQAEEVKALMQLRKKHKGFIVTDHQYHNILDVSDKIVLLNNGATKIIRNADELVTYGYLSSI